jgi:hypothetical protein
MNTEVGFEDLFHIIGFISVNNIFYASDDNEVSFVLDQHTELDFYSASSLKQQSTDRHVVTFGQPMRSKMIDILKIG